MSEIEPKGFRTAQWLLALTGLAIFALVFVPQEQFIRRCDDAFYYFKVAFNYPRTGFWTFDSIHPTNGVQPLWALLLTGLAQVLYWLGLREADLFARCSVALAALFQWGSSLLLFRLLARQVSLGVGIAAAGAFLFPIAIVWGRVSGMENSLYAFCLLASVHYFQFSFRGKESAARAVILGLLLSLTALSRLNAVLFGVCALAAALLTGRHLARSERLRYFLVAGGVCVLLVGPYLLWNYHHTGHALPISGAVKAMLTRRFFQEHGISSPLSATFLKVIHEQYQYFISWFISSRAADGFWIAGGRILFNGDSRIGGSRLALLVALFLVLPMAARGPRAWFTSLGSTFSSLLPFGYVLAYGLINFAVSVALYPHQLGYAMITWWLVESEIILVVLTSTLVVTAVGHVTARFLGEQRQRRLLFIAIAFLAVFHTQHMARTYWGGRYERFDWNNSWNDELDLAARWMSQHVPEGETVGAWNAGVLGYYSRQRVVNLDGLINNFELLPYLEDQKLGEYIIKEKIGYLSDMEGIFHTYKMHDQLKLQEIYSHPCPAMKQSYKIYKVLR